MSDIKDNIRTKIFSSNQFKSAEFLLFGERLELRQPSVGELLKLSKVDQNQDKLAVAQILIDYAYVPGSDEKVFSKADYDSIVNLPSGKWISDLIEAWGELAGGDEAKVEKNSVET